MKKEDPSKFLPFNLELALNGKEIRKKMEENNDLKLLIKCSFNYR